MGEEEWNEPKDSVLGRGNELGEWPLTSFAPPPQKRFDHFVSSSEGPVFSGGGLRSPGFGDLLVFNGFTINKSISINTRLMA